MRKILFATAVSVLLAGCNSGIGTRASADFDPQEAAFVRAPGNVTIAGNISAAAENGVEVSGANAVVRLIPVTAYARDRFNTLYAGRSFAPLSAGSRVPPADPAYAQYSRTVKSDFQGNYKFDHVGPGRYYVSAQVSCPAAAKECAGGSVYNVVNVPAGPGGTVQLNLIGD
ncbi:carboxypeptidase regulatory-like domain-containing protein [Methylovirgula sp. 4M-Z18]|uniref:carboxypeptidase regulatory-like domain-containing protein n=1 Tax=Methylovirgula sp. 4M-Z18 TaxID=2293567 RepID=UPI0011C0662F|nr:carboxypeptidase regulatory-like domain-containing protein [Methylovirgula sp. 4M-Z18]